MGNKYRWQVPGNGNPFDSILENWDKREMSQRSIGVLEYINDKKSVSKTDFEENIKAYLKDKYNHIENESIPAHFYRPLEFIGLVRNFNNNLSISIDGKNFLNSIYKKEYEKALDYYILQLFKAKYPNTATDNVKLNLFPFRIIFKLLLDYDKLSEKDFLDKIPYIKSIDDIYNYKTYNENNEKYCKWKTWVLSYLIKWNILSCENGYIFISPYKKDYISGLLNNIDYEDMFFAEEEYFTKAYYTRKIKRNKNIISNILSKYNNKCFFNEAHKTFSTKKYNNFMECHHILPLSLSDSFDKNLDCEDNLIPLCPNCHKAIHHATNTYKEPLINKIYNDSDIRKTFSALTIDDLKEIYIS